MTEHAIAIARVSTGKQHEEDQAPGLKKYADAKGYVLDAVVPIKGRSAFHGKQVKYVLAAVDQHVRNGEATVVIFRHVDRSSRGGAFEGYDLLKQIMDAGARVEFSAQEYLSDQPGMLGVFFEVAKGESQIKSDRKKQNIEANQKKGILNGQAPWGYDAKPVDGKRTLVPNALGREWIPKIFNASAEGDSLRKIRVMLAGVPSSQRDGDWHENTIRRIIANPTYSGNRKGKGELKYEALVTVELWQKANEAVKNRMKAGRSTAPSREPVFARPVCGACYGTVRDGCPSGKSPMYRDSTHGRHYYRCYGNGAAHSSCGAKMIPAAVLDAGIDQAMTHDDSPHFETVYIPGDDNSERLASIQEKIVAAARQGDMATVAVLTAEYEEVDGLPTQKARIDRQFTGVTTGEHWQALDRDERREELLRWEIRATADEFSLHLKDESPNLGPWEVRRFGVTGRLKPWPVSDEPVWSTDLVGETPADGWS